MKMIALTASLFLMTSCGIGFRIADQSGEEDEELEKRYKAVHAGDTDLLVTAPGQPFQFNDLAVTNSEGISRYYFLRDPAPGTYRVMIRAFDIGRCGDRSEMPPEFKWEELTGESLVSSREIKPQADFSPTPDLTGRLFVEVKARRGYCEKIFLRFTVHKQPS